MQITLNNHETRDRAQRVIRFILQSFTDLTALDKARDLCDTLKITKGDQGVTLIDNTANEEGMWWRKKYNVDSTKGGTTIHAYGKAEMPVLQAGNRITVQRQLVWRTDRLGVKMYKAMMFVPYKDGERHGRIVIVEFYTPEWVSFFALNTEG